MRNQPVDVGFGQIGLGQRGAGGAFQHADGQLEHGLAVHRQQRTADDFAARHLAGHAQNTDMLAVGMQVAGQNAGRLGRFEHHGARAVTKQHAGGAVGKVQNARKHFRANDKRLAGQTGFDHRVSNRQRIDKTAAHRLHVKGRAARNAELALQNARRRRKHHVRRGGREDDEVDIGRQHASGFHGAPGRFGA